MLIGLAALTRVATARGWDNADEAELAVSAPCWMLAFIEYLVTYVPYLLKARVNGKAASLNDVPLIRHGKALVEATSSQCLYI